MDKAFSARVVSRLRDLDVTTFEIDRRGGLSRGFTNDIIIGRKESVQARNLAKLASALQVSEAWLLGLDKEAPPAPREISRAVPSTDGRKAPPATSGFELAGVARPEAWNMPRDLPVYGTANGSTFGAIAVSNEPVDFVRRPPGLVGARDAYAIFVSGDSMHPEHRHGDLRIVHPHKPVSIGDTVIIQGRTAEHEPVEVFIKELVRRTAESIVAKQHNPDATLTFPKRFVVHVHKVLPMNELFGL